MVFDNWQCSLAKIWQTMGKSTIFHRGTAYLIKRNNAFVLPIGTVMVYPSGLKFTVEKVDVLNTYELPDY